MSTNSNFSVAAIVIHCMIKMRSFGTLVIATGIFATTVTSFVPSTRTSLTTRTSPSSIAALTSQKQRRDEKVFFRPSALQSSAAAPAEGDAGETSKKTSGGTATIPALIFNLVKSIVGAGVLGLPAGVVAYGNAPSAAIPAVIFIALIGLARYVNKFVERIIDGVAVLWCS
mgnify:CR=1 FL=1